jgi:hypothetical protein
LKDSENKNEDLAQIGEDLFNFAIDREDVKWLMARLPREAGIRPTTVEYELQILKIIGVGWSLSFYLENRPYKDDLLERYWKAVHEFAQSLSTTTGLMIGQDIDYFQTLKNRLDTYVEALTRNPRAPEPASVIGPEFAKICGNETDLFTFMTGAKMFLNTIRRIKEYLEAVKLI